MIFPYKIQGLTSLDSNFFSLPDWENTGIIQKTPSNLIFLYSLNSFMSYIGGVKHESEAS